MKRFSSSSSNEEAVAVDMSAMMDMVFILLIFFIVTTTFVEETGVEVNKPQAAAASNLEKNSILIAITDKGGIIYGGREIGLSGIQPLVRRLTAKEDVPVIIQSDKSVSVDLFMRVYDQALLTGAKVSVSTVK
jgi:biopolymer transport protein ExbD